MGQNFLTVLWASGFLGIQSHKPINPLQVTVLFSEVPNTEVKHLPWLVTTEERLNTAYPQGSLFFFLPFQCTGHLLVHICCNTAGSGATFLLCLSVNLSGTSVIHPDIPAALSILQASIPLLISSVQSEGYPSPCTAGSKTYLLSSRNLFILTFSSLCFWLSHSDIRHKESRQFPPHTLKVLQWHRPATTQMTLAANYKKKQEVSNVHRVPWNYLLYMCSTPHDIHSSERSQIPTSFFHWMLAVKETLLERER